MQYIFNNSEETLGRIFEPFFTTKEAGKGTGLGLAMAYGIIRQHEGMIEARSEPGRGATLSIYMPVAGGAAEEAPHTPEGAAPGGTETILVAEDDEQVRGLAQRILMEAGYTVLTADSPGRALQIISEHPDTIHLLLTDVVMPVMDGRELWDRIRSERPEMKCLFMSGYTSGDIGQGLADPAMHFIHKPFSMDIMLEKVRSVLNGTTV